MSGMTHETHLSGKVTGDINSPEGRHEEWTAHVWYYSGRRNGDHVTATFDVKEDAEVWLAHMTTRPF